MKQVYTKLLSILSIIFLIYSTSGVTQAFANDIDVSEVEEMKIKVYPNNHDDENARVIKDISGEIQSVDSGGLSHINLIGHSEDDIYSFSIDDEIVNRINPTSNYIFTFEVFYSENEKTYTYIDNLKVTGSQFLKLTSIKLPAAEDLKEAIIINDLEQDLVPTIEIYEGTEQPTKGVTLYPYQDDNDEINLVVKKDSKFSLYYSLIKSIYDDESSEGFYLYEEVDFTRGAPQEISRAYENLVEIEFETSSEMIGFSKNSFTMVQETNNRTKMSPGKYYVHYTTPNNLKWTGEIVVDELSAINSIILPNEPTELVIKDLEYETNGSNTLLMYDLIASNGGFAVENFSSNLMPWDITTKVYDDNNLVAEVNEPSNTLNEIWNYIELGNIPSGEYDVVVELNLNETDKIVGRTTLSYEADDESDDESDVPTTPPTTTPPSSSCSSHLPCTLPVDLSTPFGEISQFGTINIYQVEDEGYLSQVAGYMYNSDNPTFNLYSTNNFSIDPVLLCNWSRSFRKS
ncbi:hypothetical protein [Ureibacillus aquaedulcis]|uniref:Uncharacterized protein n=1 Tax=Ureibacillus aquaedulcis TaxID=3058421 RepID=A0ABT8GUN5_9BACL|nr:hypothetical protein [Ureibacillus sp. BA0131]MDN4495128.1 hypothetical protein [Ureibacillus sp. BA0131]